MSQFNFGQAIEHLKQGLRVCRTGWNEKGMYLLLIVTYSADYAPVTFENMLPFIGMKTADNKFVPWLASQTDVLAEDWELQDVA